MLIAMSGYAVLWQQQHDKPSSGQLGFDPHGLWLHGGSRGNEVRVEVPYDEIVAAERDPDAHIGPCRALRLHSRSAGDLLLASIDGVGTLSEIYEVLQHALPAAGRAFKGPK